MLWAAWRSTWSLLQTPNQRGARGPAWGELQRAQGLQRAGGAKAEPTPARTQRTGLSSEGDGAARRAALPESRLTGRGSVHVPQNTPLFLSRGVAPAPHR